MMDNKLFQLSAIATIFLTNVVVNAMPDINRPGYIDCLSSSECGKSKCCTIGYGRYSIPQCSSRLEYGETCRPDNEPQNSLQLTYPDNSTISLHDFYYHICPCIPGLVCSRKTGLCEDAAEHESFNYIDY